MHNHIIINHNFIPYIKLKKLIAISLSIILLFSNIGFTFATHYCSGHAVKSKLMLSKGELDCGMLKLDNSCEDDSDEASITKKSCCENAYLSLDVEDDFQPSTLLPEINIAFVLSFVYTFFELFNSSIELKSVYEDFSPPFRSIDFQVLFQSFLI